VLLGLTLGGVLLAHAGLQIARAFPPEVRASAVDAIKKRPRLAAVTAAVAAWTLVYALYSLAYPSGAALLGAPRAEAQVAAAREDAVDAPAPGVSVSDLLPPSLGGELAVADFDTTPTTSAPSGDTASDTGPPPPAVEAGPEPVPCSVEAQAEALRAAQLTVEGLMGRPLGADGAVLVEALAGCKDPTSAALSMLGPINLLLNDAGVPVLDLPDAPGVPFPPVPEPIAAPLRAQVFDVCGRILAQAYPVAAVAPVFRVSFDDAVATINIVADACGSFAPARSAS
jgi:hypothetical protein